MRVTRDTGDVVNRSCRVSFFGPPDATVLGIRIHRVDPLRLSLLMIPFVALGIYRIAKRVVLAHLTGANGAFPRLGSTGLPPTAHLFNEVLIIGPEVFGFNPQVRRTEQRLKGLI